MAGLWLLYLVGVGAVAGSVLPADRTNSPCQPGTVWTAEDGCNTCFCLDSGVPGCSRMECSARNPAADKTASGSFDNDMKPLPLPKPDIIYEAYGDVLEPKPLPLPGQKTEWKSASGSFGSATKPLPLPKPEDEVKPYGINRDNQKPEPEPLPKPEEKPVEERSGVSCVQGEEWKEDCNSCFCLGDGRAACTKMACSSESRALAEAVKPHCEVGTSWSDNCNVCHCVNDSRVICSYRSCAGAERRRRQTDCTPGTTQQVDCNTCVCLRDGRLGCTFKFCLPENSQQTSQFSSGSVRSFGSSDCVRECPADCGSVRGEDGCLTCQCDINPFFRAHPLPEAASADRSWTMPYGARQSWGRADDSRMQRHSFGGGGERSMSHRHSAQGDIISDSDHHTTYGFSASAGGAGRDSARTPFDAGQENRFTPPGSRDSGRFTPPGYSSTGGFTSFGDFDSHDSGHFAPSGGSDSDRFAPSGGSDSDRFASSGGSDSGRFGPSGRYGTSSTDRFSSAGNVGGSTIRFVDRPSSGGGGGSGGGFSSGARRGQQDSRSGGGGWSSAGGSGGGFSSGARRGQQGGESGGGGGTAGRQSSWEAFSSGSGSQREAGKTADEDGWTSVGRK